MLINVIICTFVTSVYANADYFREHQSGWHWYKDGNAGSKKKLPKKEEQNQYNKMVNKKMNDIQNNYETARKEMILSPTEENVARYINLQYSLLKQADRVSSAWKNALAKNPELNRKLIDTESVAVKQNDDEAIKLIANKVGLFYFYSSTCPYCKRFSPVVKELAAQYQINVIPISLDGNSSPEFSNSQFDNGQAARFNVQAVPALFVVNPYNNQTYQIAYGFIPLNELKQALLDVKDKLMKGVIA